MTYSEKARRTLCEYTGDARQLQVKWTLEPLRLRSFMKEKEVTDITEGLTKLFDHINALTPQCPFDFWSDAHIADYLRKVVTEDQSWSRIPIQNIKSQGYCFNKFHKLIKRVTLFKLFLDSCQESKQNLQHIRRLIRESVSSNTGIVENFDTHVLRYGRNPHRNQRNRGKMRNGSHQPRFTRNRQFDEAQAGKECYPF